MRTTMMRQYTMMTNTHNDLDSEDKMDLVLDSLQILNEKLDEILERLLDLNTPGVDYSVED